MTIAFGKGKKVISLPEKTGRKIAGIIKRGLALKAKTAQMKAEIEKNNASIIPFADKNREVTGLKSAVFKSDDGKVNVKYTSTVVYEEKDMPKIREILGPAYPLYFNEVPGFVVNGEDIPEITKKLGADTDRLVHRHNMISHTPRFVELLCDGDSKLGKQLRDLAYIRPNTPTVSYEPAKEQ